MIYLPYLFSFLSFFIALYAIARVSSLSNNVKKVGFEDFSDVHSDVQALKNQLKKTNNRLSGMDSPKHDAELEAQQLLQRMALNGSQPMQQTKRQGG